MSGDKTRIIRLLRTARGQVEGIIKMIENDRYCVDVSNQIMASQAILSKVNNEILLAHIENCVLNAPVEEQEEKMKELATVLDNMY